MRTDTDELDILEAGERIKRRILVFFGRFDPVITAHVTLLKRLEATLSPDILIIFTKADRFENEPATIAGSKVRHTMLNAAMQGEADVAPILEMREADPPYTVTGTSWTELAQPTEYGHGLGIQWLSYRPASYLEGLEHVAVGNVLDYDPTYDTLLVAVGSDEVPNLLECNNFQAVSNMAELWWTPRDGEDSLEVPPLRKVLLDTEGLTGMSSTAVRESLAAGVVPAAGTLPAAILEPPVRLALGVYLTA